MTIEAVYRIPNEVEAVIAAFTFRMLESPNKNTVAIGVDRGEGGIESAEISFEDLAEVVRRLQQSTNSL